MFKKKKKDEYVEPVKPKNRVLKVFDEYRLIEKFSARYEPIQYNGKDQRIIGYENQLILEKKDKNAMDEPFYKHYQEEPVSRETKKALEGYYRVSDTYEKDRLLFDFFREIYLNAQSTK